jgi:pimeloyl-ACP methyl ester carboxylesterase
VNWLSLGVGLLVGAAAEQLATVPLRRRSESVVTPRPACWTEIELDTPDGGVLRGVEAGSGPPLVLLHGITLRADVWHRQWALADEARVIAVDLRGHGGSEAGHAGSTIEANARDLAFLLEALDLEGAVLAGHSMGGMVVGRFIADHLLGDQAEALAHRVAGVGFISTAGRSPVGLANDLLRSLALPVQRFTASNPRLARRLVSIPDNDLGQVMVRSTFGKRPDLRDVRETADAFDSLEVTQFLEAAPSILDHDVLDSLRHCRIPAAVIVGRRDPLTPVRESRRLAAALPEASIDIVDGAGHQLMLERPDEVNAMLRQLLARSAVRAV